MNRVSEVENCSQRATSRIDATRWPGIACRSEESPAPAAPYFSTCRTRYGRRRGRPVGDHCPVRPLPSERSTHPPSYSAFGRAARQAMPRSVYLSMGQKTRFAGVRNSCSQRCERARDRSRGMVTLHEWSSHPPTSAFTLANFTISVGYSLCAG